MRYIEKNSENAYTPKTYLLTLQENLSPKNNARLNYRKI